jgi:hypothetical protein
MAAAPPQPSGEPIDIRHDLTGRRDFALVPRLDEVVLHVDDQQGGLAGRHPVERMQFAHPPRHPLQSGWGDCNLVHRCILYQWSDSNIRIPFRHIPYANV